MDMRTLNDMFKVKIEHEGKPLYKSKVKGVKGLKKVFKELEFKLG